MTGPRIKALLVLALAVSAFMVSLAWRPTAHLADIRPKVSLEKIFPKAFGAWTLDEHLPVQLVSPDTQASLNKIYNQLLSRTYKNPQGERIMLSVAYGGDQSDSTRAHRPEICYPSQGFEILSNHVAVLDVGKRTLHVRQLLSRMGGRIEPVTYWVMVGERVTLSGTEQKLAQLSYSTRGLIPDGILVRVSSIDGDEIHAYQLQQSFLGELVDSIAGEWQSFVVGRRSV